jgi:rod shape-determining protein MreC
MARVVGSARRSRLLLGVFVLGHLLLISRQVDRGGGTSLLGQIVLGLLSPAQRTVSVSVGGVRDAWGAYIDLRAVQEENLGLKTRVAALETRLQQREPGWREAERLRGLLELRSLLPFDSVAAEVVARDGLPWFRTLIADKGLAAGVRLDTPVVCSSGVVGRVIAVGPFAAKVQTLLDQASGVGVIVERSRTTGVVSGQLGFADSGATDLLMKYVAATADVAVDDVVLTSGLDGIYPKGLVVGRVRAVGPASGLFREVLVTPSARFDEVEEVLMLKGMPSAPVLTEAVRPEPPK